MIVGIYHNRDLDGYCSGAIIKHRHPEAKLIGYDYGQPFDMDLITGKDVIMADVSLPMDKMEDIANYSKTFTWIDHHKSSIRDFFDRVKENPLSSLQKIKAILNSTISACEGTWIAFYTAKSMPMAVQLLGEYDTWRNEDKERWEEKILPFQYGMRSICNSAETFPVKYLDKFHVNGVSFVIEKGKAVLDYIRKHNEAYCRSYAFEFEWKGYKVVALNVGLGNSNMFDSVYDPEKHDIMMPFLFNGAHWKFSLYTTHDHIDCSILAKEEGGGGHKKAAGFQKENLFEVFSSNIATL